MTVTITSISVRLLDDGSGVGTIDILGSNFGSDNTAVLTNTETSLTYRYTRLGSINNDSISFQAKLIMPTGTYTATVTNETIEEISEQSTSFSYDAPTPFIDSVTLGPLVDDGSGTIMIDISGNFFTTDNSARMRIDFTGDQTYSYDYVIGTTPNTLSFSSMLTML